MNVLVVAAHPSDEVLGAGGTIANHVQSGDSVTVAILGEGYSARVDSMHTVDPHQLSNLKASTFRAASILGYSRREYENIINPKKDNLDHFNSSTLEFYDLPDNRFDSVDLLDIVRLIEVLVKQVQPHVIYTHHSGDLNIDHCITAKAVLTACRPLPETSVKKILTFEMPSATGWTTPDQVFQPTVFVDISNTLAAKLEAVKVYKTELRAFPHARSLKSIKARAVAWGAHVGLEAAEPFCLIREIR